ncbi:MAG: acyltransferase domain-containing protein [Polyangiaceae bacterium]|nr:acyltransferase domain-containing protein [Polyangiaceae bacterium]
MAWSLVAELADTADTAPIATDPRFIQPALTAVQIAISEASRDRSSPPSFVVGLSMGEVAAAHCAGILSTQDAMAVVCVQAELTAHTLRPGKMVFARAGRGPVERALAVGQGRAVLAVTLAPELSVVSGERTAVDAVAAELHSSGVMVGPLPIGFAFHSPEMAALSGPFMDRLAALRPQTGALPMYSSATGGCVQGTDLHAEHWWRIMSGPALFDGVIGSLLDLGEVFFAEINPEPLLADAIRDIARPRGVAPTVVATMSRRTDTEIWPQSTVHEPE